MNNKKVTTLFLTGIVTASMASSPILGAITSADEIAEEQILDKDKPDENLIPEGNDTEKNTDYDNNEELETTFKGTDKDTLEGDSEDASKNTTDVTDSVDKKNTNNTSENNASSDKDVSTVSNKTVEKKEIANERIVDNIIVDGNENISQEDILKFITHTKVGEVYSRNNVKADLADLISSGIVQNAKARSMQNNGEIYIVFDIVELKEVKEVVIKGNSIIPTEEIMEKLSTVSGELFNKDKVEKDIEVIKDMYREKGYIALVTNVNNNDGVVTFTISEAKVESINYIGNTKTKNWVIDKTVSPLVKAGDNLKTETLQNLYIQLMKTGYFEEVNISADNGIGVDGIVLNITFKEAQTGSWTLGGAYNTTYKLQAVASIGDTNLNGEGKSYHFDIAVGKNKTFFNLNYTDLYWKKTDTKVYFNLFKSSKDVNTQNSSYKDNRFGGTIGMKKPISQDKKTSFFGEITVDNINTDYISGEKVDGMRSNTITLGIQNDRRDDTVDPSNGSIVTVGTTLSSKLLGSSNNFAKFFAEAKTYSKISARDVFATRFAFNYSPNNLPTVEQFALGGADSLRGINEDSMRGNKSLLGTLEFRHHFNDDVQGVAFVDAGKAWNDEVQNALKVAVGVGVRIKTAMGILRLDAAKANGEGMKYMFGIGHSF